MDTTGCVLFVFMNLLKSHFNKSTKILLFCVSTEDAVFVALRKLWYEIYVLKSYFNKSTKILRFCVSTVSVALRKL